MKLFRQWAAPAFCFGLLLYSVACDKVGNPPVRAIAPKSTANGAAVGVQSTATPVPTGTVDVTAIATQTATPAPSASPTPDGMCTWFSKNYKQGDLGIWFTAASVTTGVCVADRMSCTSGKIVDMNGIEVTGKEAQFVDRCGTSFHVDPDTLISGYGSTGGSSSGSDCPGYLSSSSGICLIQGVASGSCVGVCPAGFNFFAENVSHDDCAAAIRKYTGETVTATSILATELATNIVRTTFDGGCQFSEVSKGSVFAANSTKIQPAIGASMPGITRYCSCKK